MFVHVPNLLKQVPTDLDICQAPPSDLELHEFLTIRKRYASDPEKAVAEADKIRAFRLLKGMKCYLEVGTFDKFNLRYIMELLDPAATIVDLDITENAAAKSRLEGEKPTGQIYHCIIGDSSSIDTRDNVKRIPGEAHFDAVFIDANHVAKYVMIDFALYGELISPTGYCFFHDVRWEGNDRAKGVADALDILQRFVPIYQVLGAGPVTHWHRPLVRQANNWGGIAIIRGQDLHDRIR